MERLRRFNIGSGTSILGGVRRKALWVSYVQCQVPGCKHEGGWLDKITTFPHTVTCPAGHVQIDSYGERVRIDSDQAQEIARWGLYRDIAASAAFGARAGVSKSDNVITPSEFFSQGVNQATNEDKILAKRIKSLGGLI